MKQARDLRAAWSRGETTFGVWAALPCPFAAEFMAIPGISYVCVDQQHGVIDYSEMVSMSRGIEGRGAVPITRVPANETWLISKALDAGLQGVVVPLVNSGAEAAAAVAACRYPPKGVRSYGPTRASLVMDVQHFGGAGNSVVCFAMVETREALEQIDEIARTPGLDGIYLGRRIRLSAWGSRPISTKPNLSTRQLLNGYCRRASGTRSSRAFNAAPALPAGDLPISVFKLSRSPRIRHCCNRACGGSWKLLLPAKQWPGRLEAEVTRERSRHGSSRRSRHRDDCVHLQIRA